MPSGGRATARAIPGAQLLMIDGMGHDLPREPLGPDRGRHRGERGPRGRAGSARRRRVASGGVPTIARAGADALDRLEPLWLELHHHHQAVGGERLGPYVTDGVSWPLRRKLYADVLATAASCCWRTMAAARSPATRRSRSPPSADSLLGDTWRTGPRVAEIETLLVLPTRAGPGSAVRCSTGSTPSWAEGVADVFIGAVLTNTDAIRLYERRGFRPAWVYMLRLADAPPGRSRLPR